ncbi:MAG: hypothetical protein Q4F67_02710 [Propionibacteriaceae bacterium]|nr:hypothetical protein [Propionibacteriaceae bacterium]
MKIYAAVAVLGLVLATGCSAPTATDPAIPTDHEPTAPTTVATELPGLTPPSGDPDLPSLREAQPRPGEAIRVAGPFDDRFEIDDLTFDGREISGSVRVTSDVSALIDLQVVGGFYDANGQLLGVERWDHHADGEDHDHDAHVEEATDFAIPVPEAAAGAAVSAAVGVPVLVNE